MTLSNCFNARKVVCGDNRPKWSCSKKWRHCRIKFTVENLEVDSTQWCDVTISTVKDEWSSTRNSWALLHKDVISQSQWQEQLWGQKYNYDGYGLSDGWIIMMITAPGEKVKFGGKVGISWRRLQWRARRGTWKALWRKQLFGRNEILLTVLD